MKRSLLLRASTVGILAGLLFAACWGCATHRIAVAPARSGIGYAELANYLGVTFCYDDQVHSFVSTGVSGVEEADTRAHEAKHREQFARFASCDQALAWLHTPSGTIQAEAEAYAAGWCLSVAAGVDSVALRESYVARIVAVLGSEINRPAVEHAFTRYTKCGKAAR